MKRPSKALLAKWDKKLAKAGFVDQESRETELMHKHHDVYWRLRFTPESFEERRRYFELATRWLHDGTFETGRHKTAWSHHCEGLSYREIAKLMKLDKMKVSEMLRRCQQESRLRYDINS